MPVSRLIGSAAVALGLSIAALLAWPTTPLEAQLDRERNVRAPIEPPRLKTAQAESNPHQPEPLEMTIRKAGIRTALRALANRAVGPVRFGQGPLSLRGNSPEIFMPRPIACTAPIVTSIGPSISPP